MLFQRQTRRNNNRQHQLNMMAAGIALACIVTLILLQQVFGNHDIRTSPEWNQSDRRPTVSEYLARQMSRPAQAQSADTRPEAVPASPAPTPEPVLPETIPDTAPAPGNVEASPTPTTPASAAEKPAETRGEGDWPPSETEPAWAPDSTFTSKLGSMVGSLLVIALVTWGSLKLLALLFPNLGRARGRSRGLLMEVLEKQAVSPGIQICLVRVAKKHLVVGMTDQSVNLICEISAEELEAEQSEEPAEDLPSRDTAAAESPQVYRKILAHYLSIIPGMGASRK